ncbi:MAG: PAS domain S-box protein, partial [Desulfobacterales bacterium]
MAAKPTYEELEKRIKRQDKFLDVFPDLICIFTEDGYFKYLNKTWEKTLGFSLDELMSKPILDFIHPGDVEYTLEEVRKQLSGDRSSRAENRYRCKDGSYKTFEWHATPAYDGNFYAVGRDVTERKQAEEELRHVEKRLHLALDSGYAIAFEWDIERDEVYRFTSDYSELPSKTFQPNAFSEFMKMVDPE